MGKAKPNGSAFASNDDRVELRFRLPGTTDEAEVTVGNGVGPGAIAARWLSPGPGRDTLNRLLSELFILEVDHLATAVAAGQSYRVAPLSELAQRAGWTVESRVEGNPATYRLGYDGEAAAAVGPRQDLLLILELLLRCALRLFASQTEVPTWVERARLAHSKLLDALQGHTLFQQAG